MTSSQKIAANRINAASSTGPRSVTGKTVSRANAVRHGVLATVAAIDADEQAAFDELLAALDADLKPVGPLEEALVEKIALALWRNRRLARAERGSLSLQLQSSRIVRSASHEVLGGFDPEVAENDLDPVDPEVLAWNKAILAEFGNALSASVDELPDVAPKIYRQLIDDAEAEDPAAIKAYLAQEYDGGLPEYVLDLAKWSRRQVSLAERRPELLAMAETMRDRAQLLTMSMQHLLARYQTMLDAQLYKAIRALREAQKDRREAIDAEAVDAPMVEAEEITAA